MSEAIGWAILELMGHRRLAGYVSEQEIAGSSFLRLDIPAAGGDEPEATQYYSPAAVYCITPASEEFARAVARYSNPAPAARWELPAPEPPDEGDGVDAAAAEDDAWGGGPF